MKIRIIGYAGSGKTSLTIKLQEKYLIQGISLDDFLKIKDKNQRFTLLNSRLSSLDAWIVEGVQVSSWTKQTFDEAQLIVILDYPIFITQYRVFKRTVSQVFDKSRSFEQKKKVIKRMFKLFKWNHRFRKRLPSIKTNLYNQTSRVMILESPKDEKRLHQYMKNQQRMKKHAENRKHRMRGTQ
ncbi:P-loop NTPase family protein [Vagococcus hydrophili]|uniref:DNA topology modulation protein FlaR n=1 Tax=Vagococcus hydrophili TaxID=2714947 RepID=A0A6G8AVS1_9ENTE|nr:hypothetical protein [Vagococcus hydrophili]QIL49035.1 hypothetical protein G7082_11325 [Vagococcus hydrophili]